MPAYRIYPLDRHGKIFSASDGEYDNDAAAMTAARAMTPIGTRADVWQLARRIGQVSGEGQRSSIYP